MPAGVLTQSSLASRLAKLLALARIGVLVWMAYRVTSLIKLIDFPLNIAVYYFLFAALYRALPEGSRTLGATSHGELLTYIALVWIIESLINTRLDRDMGHEVREGKIALILARPLDFQAFYFFQSLGHIAYRLVLMTLPIALVALLLFDLRGPASGLHGLWFGVSLVGAFVLMFQIGFLFGLSALFMEYNAGSFLIKETLFRGLGGLYIPIAILPEALQQALTWTPFLSLYYVPAQVYQGHLGGGALFQALALQWGWILAFQLINRLVLAAGLRRVQIVGG